MCSDRGSMITRRPSKPPPSTPLRQPPLSNSSTKSEPSPGASSTQNPDLQKPREGAPRRGAGYAIVPEPPPGTVTRFAQWRYRAPSGSASRSIFPATRQAAGAPSAWSQPSQSTNARPRRWRDAGSLERQSVTAAQKAGTEGMVRNNGSDRDRGRIRIRWR